MTKHALDTFLITPDNRQYMETYSRIALSNLLVSSPLRLFDLTTLKQTLNIRSESAFYRILNQFVSEKVLAIVKPGVYYKVNTPPDQYEIANYLIRPSYISFETALNHHGILPQFPLITTSATTQKTQKKTVFNGDYTYTHLSPKMFFGFKKYSEHLLAEPEKCLIDYVYLRMKLGTKPDMNEWDFEHVDTKKLSLYLTYMEDVKGYQSVVKIISEQTPCLPTTK